MLSRCNRALRLAAGLGGVRFAIAMDFSVSTSSWYKSPSEVPFTGPYAATRSMLDYSWHVHYVPERQALQDSIVSRFLANGVRSERPWLVYTAGPMGAGKSHTLRYLHSIGAFPLDRFTWVDADKIKSLLPDMPGYVRHNRASAGTLTHKESGFIAEIIEKEALRASKCVLVDGSLRDRDWYARWFGRVRAEFPQYRIAIVLVTASRERVYERAKKRAAITAREVPLAVLDDAIEKVPRSYEALAPLSDYSVVIDNDAKDGVPSVVPPETLESFKAAWLDVLSVPIDRRSEAEAGAGAGGAGAQPGADHASMAWLLRSESEMYASLMKEGENIASDGSIIRRAENGTTKEEQATQTGAEATPGASASAAGRATALSSSSSSPSAYSGAVGGAEKGKQ
jgi:hypothetical protein